jgi:uncharacterized 2Fe-2S/4Fe-4S cluster protein (DUF4445 family)
MVTIKIAPSGRIITAPEGFSLREALQQAGILLDYPCGGKGQCRHCRVLVSPDTESGKGNLPASEIESGVRLVCRLILEKDYTVTIPDNLLSKKLWKQGPSSEDIAIAAGTASIRRYTLSLPEPTLEDQKPDWERIAFALERQGLLPGSPDAGSLEHLSLTLRESDWQIEVFSEEKEFLWVSGAKNERAYGFAVDLGTTTVDMALFDLESGERIARKVLLNRQISFGADVISRAESFHADRVSGRGRPSGAAATPGQGRPSGSPLREPPVRAAALQSIAEGARSILQEAGVSPDQVFKTVIVGNPIMIHILLGIDPHQLTVSPFALVTSRSLRVRPCELSWDFQDHGYVETLPLISAYIGADTIGMIVSLDLEREVGTSLAIDIGTNGEMVLARDGALLATSTAAGPAFEGAQISCGMRALEGAIYSVSILEDGTVICLTVGNGRAQGICGTGLISAVAQMLDRGIVDATGRLLDPREVELPELKKRLIIRNGEKAFDLSGNGDVFISQGDVRKLQLAKGAVRTGIETLLDVAGVSLESIAAVRLAGNFGAGLDTVSAMRIGLIPAMDPRKVEAVGNAALRGAALVLLSREHARRAESASRHTAFIELGGKPEFQARFSESMMFPS